MTTIIENIHRRELKEYQQLNIELIRLDNEISLALECDLPFPKGETRNNIPGCMTDDPYKTFTV